MPGSPSALPRLFDSSLSIAAAAELHPTTLICEERYSMKNPIPHLFRASVLLLLSGLMPLFVLAQPQQVSVGDLTRQAELVIVGKVAGIRSEWNDNRTRIQSRVTVAVSQVIKGDGAGSAITIVTPGGEVDGVGELYTDMPTFRQEEDVLVFARKDSQGNLRVAAGQQGKISLHMDEVSGKMMIAGGQPLDDFASQLRKSVQSQIQK